MEYNFTSAPRGSGYLWSEPMICSFKLVRYIKSAEQFLDVSLIQHGYKFEICAVVVTTQIQSPPRLVYPAQTLVAVPGAGGQQYMNPPPPLFAPASAYQQMPPGPMQVPFHPPPVRSITHH
jgi:hypothetical protein